MTNPTQHCANCKSLEEQLFLERTFEALYDHVRSLLHGGRRGEIISKRPVLIEKSEWALWFDTALLEEKAAAIRKTTDPKKRIERIELLLERLEAEAVVEAR